MYSEYIISTNAQKALHFLLLHANTFYYEKEIVKGAKISCGSANAVLRQLYKKSLIQRKIEGKMRYYSVDTSNPYIKEFKNLVNLLLIEPLIERLKSHTHKIVLYGSWASGTDTKESDIDLFIVSSNKDKVRALIDKYSYSDKIANRKIQAVIAAPANLLRRDEKEKVYMEEIRQGKILWEREINESNL